MYNPLALGQMISHKKTTTIGYLFFNLYSFRILAFGAGRRVCAAEALAKNRIFLFVTCLLQKFKFLPSRGKLAPKHDPRSYRFGHILLINDYNIVAKSRCMGEYWDSNIASNYRKTGINWDVNVNLSMGYFK